MSERMMQFWVGLFALAAVVLFCVLLSWFGDLPNHFKEKRYVIATYRNAGGVGIGTPVYRSGIRVDEVLASTANRPPTPPAMASSSPFCWTIPAIYPATTTAPRSVGDCWATPRLNSSTTTSLRISR